MLATWVKTLYREEIVHPSESKEDFFCFKPLYLGAKSEFL